MANVYKCGSIDYIVLFLYHDICLRMIVSLCVCIAIKCAISCVFVQSVSQSKSESISHSAYMLIITKSLLLN